MDPNRRSINIYHFIILLQARRVNVVYKHLQLNPQILRSFTNFMGLTIFSMDFFYVFETFMNIYYKMFPVRFYTNISSCSIDRDIKV